MIDKAVRHVIDGLRKGKYKRPLFFVLIWGSIIAMLLAGYILYLQNSQQSEQHAVQTAIQTLSKRESGASIPSIRVTSDDNYPPYIFRNEHGYLHGILVDEWRLWEEKTGVHVELNALDWSKAQEIMASGQADVIDTMFITPERAKIYDFTQPYANIDVPIFYHKSISGIVDVQTLRGFTVGVKEGDACVDMLKDNNITTLQYYPNYKSIIDAAGNGEIKVFCLDEPPANYYLDLRDLETEYQKAFILYSGQFHRAVHKGDHALLTLVEEGFKSISLEEMNSIKRKWIGSALDVSQYITYGIYIVVILAVMGLILTLWNLSLRASVRRKTAELSFALKEIQESEERFRLAFMTGLDAISITRLSDGFHVDVNDNHTKTFGFTREEICGKSALDVGIWPIPAQRAKMVDELNKNSFVDNMETRLRRKDGTLFTALLSSRSIMLHGIPHSITYIKNIDEYKRNEQALQEKTQEIHNLNEELEQRVRERTAQLQAANKELESFAYSISHDLRAPLRAMAGFSSILLSDYNDRIDGQGMDYLQRIQSAAQLMGHLIDDLLNLSRMTRRMLVPEPVDLSAMTQHILGELSMMNPERKVKTIIAPGIVAEGDAHMLRIVLVHLLSNAWKFSSAQPEARIEFGETSQNDERTFFVRDNGVGFDMSFSSKLFEPFQRLHPIDKFPGTGIGLATVKRILQRHGGRIWFEAEPNSGAVFYFTLGDNKQGEQS